LIFRFIHDKSKDEEYFLEIATLKGQQVRLIPVSDIEEIEPLHGSRFLISYVTSPMGSNLPFVGSLAMRA
jgi:hypothetical protein